METYHFFEVSDKGSKSTPIIFHAMGNMDNQSILKVEDSEYKSWGPKFAPESQSMH